ncbi:MAG: hypothetical protein QNK04_19675 [Myxococcota bacterium]|nr:hypothetical protein [Myxococcota bacterium]
MAELPIVVAACLVILLAAGALWRQRPPSRQRFVAEVRRRLEAEWPGEEVRYDAAEFTYELCGDEPLRINLHNLWKSYSTCPAGERQAVMEAFVAVGVASRGFALPDDWKEARSHLMPRVRNRSYLNAICSNGDESPEQAVERITVVPSDGLVPDHLIVEIVFDLPDRTSSISRSQVETWGQSPETVFDVAMQNLRVRRTNPTQLEPMGEGLYLSAWRDSYDASRILVPEIFRRIELRGAPLAFLFSNDVLLVSGTEEAHGVHAAAETMAQHLESARVESLIPLVLGDDDRWRAWEVPKHGDAALALRNLRVEEQAWDYGDQKAMLEARHEETGEDVFVASILVIEDPKTGRRDTVGTWSEGVDTLLPQTDYIAFLRDPEGEEETLLVPWNDAFPLVSSLLEPTPHYPPRFRARRFPTPEALTHLRPLTRT